jgi:hypothetical protein
MVIFMLVFTINIIRLGAGVGGLGVLMEPPIASSIKDVIGGYRFRFWASFGLMPFIGHLMARLGHQMSYYGINKYKQMVESSLESLAL